MIGATLGFFVALATVGKREKQALLARRILRLGRLRRYDRLPLPSLSDAPRANWYQDERFEKSLAKAVGFAPNWFETPPGDSVVVKVEARWIAPIDGTPPAPEWTELD